MLSRRATTAIARTALALGLACGVVASPSWAQRAGEKGGPGLALAAAKALVASWDGEQVVDGALVLVKDGNLDLVKVCFRVLTG